MKLVFQRLETLDEQQTESLVKIWSFYFCSLTSTHKNSNGKCDFTADATSWELLKVRDIFLSVNDLKNPPHISWTPYEEAMICQDFQL